MTEADAKVMTKAKLAHLQKKHRSACRLPTCHREFQVGDLTKRIGHSFYHEDCWPKAFCDDDCEGDGEENDDFFEDEYNDEEAK